MKKHLQKLINKLKQTSKKSLLVFFVSLFIFLFVAYVGVAYATGPDRWILASKIPGPIRSAGRVVVTKVANLPYLHYQALNHELPQYHINLDPADLEKIINLLPKNPSAQLTDENKVYVPATLTYNGQVYEGRLRHRGVSRNHWLWPKKSYRFQFSNDSLLNGGKNLNLIVPIDRLYFVEELDQHRARKLGLPVPRSEYATVTINGGPPMVYWATGQFDREFLEKTNNLTADANLYGESDAYIKDRVFDVLYESTSNWRKYNEGVHLSEHNYAEIDHLLEILNHPSDEYFKEHIFSILDKENFYAWSVQNALAFGNHQDWEHNMKLYFDTSIGKLKMIPWDVAIEDLENGAELPNVFEEHSNPLSNRILSFPEFMSERNQKLWDYLQDEKNLEDDLKHYDTWVEKTKVAFYQDSVKRYFNSFFDSEVADFRRVVVSNIEILKNMFEDVESELELIPVSDTQAILSLKTESLSPLAIESAVVDSATVLNYNPEISPKIVIQQLPSPPAIYPVENDYYKAFQLQPKFTNIQVRSNSPLDWSKVKASVVLTNTNSEESFVLNI